VAGNALIIVLAAALLLAVGVLVFGLGRLICGIAHYYLRERQPTREVRHPAYGVLTSDGMLWAGIAHPDGREIRFTVSGTNSEPNKALLHRVGSIVGTFAEAQGCAVEFLRRREPEISKAALDVYGLEVLDEKHPDDFMMEFLADRDDSRVWRVEFKSGKPEQTGFDD
jgi:hypothetical protein